MIEHPVNTPRSWSERAETIKESWLACGWSESGQSDRHEAVIDALDPQPGETLLDWGCGTGDLCKLLLTEVRYIGFDSAAGMVNRAIRVHANPRRRFQTSEPTERVDLVACVGPFNLPGGWAKERTWHTLRHLWDTTGCRALAASLYAGHDPSCLHYDEDEIAQVGRQLARDVEIEWIRGNDLMLVARR